MLLDEPLSAFDPSLRTQMREELKRLQRELGIISVDVVAGRRRRALAQHRLRLPAAGGGLSRLGSGLGLAKHLTGLQLDAACQYLNWHLSGWAGTFLNRQGYCSAVLETAQAQMSANCSCCLLWPDGGLAFPANGVSLHWFGRLSRRRR